MEPWTAPDDAPDHTVLVVFESQVLDRFLLARHRVRGWELPGGHVEAGESLLEAARREWDEETGLPLHRLEPLLLHERPGGARGHIFLGAMTENNDLSMGTSAERLGEDEKIEEVRRVRALADVAPLAFPDDPYVAVAHAVWERAEAGDWQRCAGETRDAFVARLADHPEAHPSDHRVVRHPAAGSAEGRFRGAPSTRPRRRP